MRTPTEREKTAPEHPIGRAGLLPWLTILRAGVAALAERAQGDPPESWNPREHPDHPRLIAGELLERRVKPGRGFEGADAETVLVRTPEGKDWLVRLFATVLQQEFAGLAVGEVVAVKYEGHVDGGRGARGYEHFRVVVDQRPPGETSPPAPGGHRVRGVRVRRA